MVGIMEERKNAIYGDIQQAKDSLRADIDDINKTLENLKVKSGNQILKVINEILGEYSSNESISLVIEKKNVVMGKTSLDITNDILELLNKKIKKIEVK